MIDLVEAQKLREALWVEEGRERFVRHCAKAEARGETSTPAGAVVMKRCAADMTKRLETEGQTISESRSPGKSRIALPLSILGAEHLSAMIVHTAIQLCWKSDQDRVDPKLSTVVAKAKNLGEALEHDIRFRVFADGAAGEAEKKTIDRMKREMASGNRSAWSKRLKALREFTTIEWTDEFRVCLGMDLLGLLVEACPHTFEAPVVRYGGKTITLLRMTEAAAEATTTAMDVAAVCQPRFGMMLVKPRPWRYVDRPS